MYGLLSFSEIFVCRRAIARERLRQEKRTLGTHYKFTFKEEWCRQTQRRYTYGSEGCSITEAEKAIAHSTELRQRFSYNLQALG
jgi:hypothetical protein